MKNRDKNSTILGFILAIFIFIVFTIYLSYFMYPSIVEIQNDKSIVLQSIKNLDEIEKKGFDFTEFKKLNSSLLEDSNNEKIIKVLEDFYYKEIYKMFDVNFYNKYIYNNSNIKKTFGEYLKNKKVELDSVIEGNEFNDQIIKITKVLPRYSNYTEINKGLTDLDFINYIEQLLNKYHLKAHGSIGIKELLPVESSIINKEDNIYYIPLHIKITGAKISILNFLEYIKNTGNIQFNNNNFSFTDKIGSSSQLSEVSSIKMTDYFDTSYKMRLSKYSLFKDFLINTNQSNDIISADVNLRFYISALSTEKIRDKINSIIGNNNRQVIFNDEGKPKRNEKTGQIEYKLIHYNYKNLLNIAKKLRSNSILNENIYYKKKIDNIFMYLNNSDLKKDFAGFKKELGKAKNIDNIYKKTLQYKEIFLKLDNDIYMVAKSLGLDTDKIDEETGKIIQKSIYPSNYIFENK